MAFDSIPYFPDRDSRLAKFEGETALFTGVIDEVRVYGDGRREFVLNNPVVQSVVPDSLGGFTATSEPFRVGHVRFLTRRPLCLPFIEAGNEVLVRGKIVGYVRRNGSTSFGPDFAWHVSQAATVA